MADEKKDEKKADRWTQWVALSMAIMAVGAGVLTLYMGKYSSRAIITQGKITNQWGYFQAKSIKQHMCELHKQQLDIAVAERSATWSAETRTAFERATAAAAKEVSRYSQEKAEIKAEAEGLEQTRDDAQQRGGKLSYALILAQIAIMLSSVTLITKKRPLWYLGLAMFAVAGVLVAMAFGLL
jgi:hypothetical protein